VLKAVEPNTGTAVRPAQAEMPPAGTLPAGCSLSLATTLRSLGRLEHAWRDLEQHCSVPPTVFQCYDWVRQWCEIYAQPESQSNIHIVIGRRQNEVVFIWPLVLQDRHGLRVLTWAGHPIGQYGDLLIAAGESAEVWIRAATSYIKSNHVADILHLRHVRETSNFAPVARMQWYDGKLNEQAPAMDLSTFKSDEDYSQRYDGQQRKRRKKSQRKMEEAFGAMTVNALQPGDAAHKAIDLAISEKLKWLEERGRFNQVLSCPSHTRLLKKILHEKDSGLRLTVLEIAMGETPSAWEIGFEWNGIHYGYITSHRDGLTDFGIGRLTLDVAQRQALKTGVLEYDLMVPYDQHKESFSSHKERVNDWFKPLTLRGAFIGIVYIGIARPALRGVYRKLPASVLRVLKHLLRQ